MKYFNGTMTADEVKARYRSLAKQYHPDLNPATRDECNAIMVEINAEYETAVKIAYRRESGDKYSAAVEESIVNLTIIIDQIVTLDGIEIEICGSWIWVGGNTYPVKDTLRDLGFKFSGSKKKWYFAENLAGKKRGHYSMDQIRSKYGVTTVETRKVAQIG